MTILTCAQALALTLLMSAYVVTWRLIVREQDAME
jgi:hypothetical protein